MKIPPTVGGYKSVATAAFMVLATLALSMFPTNAGDVTSIEAEAETGVLGCGDTIMLEDFSGPKHQWDEMNDPGTSCCFSLRLLRQYRLLLSRAAVSTNALYSHSFAPFHNFLLDTF